MCSEKGMVRKEYWCEFDKATRYEPIIREYLFNNSNIIRLTNIITLSIGLFYFKTIGSKKDKRFINTLETLNNLFLKKEINNKRFNDVVQFKKSKHEHYFYKFDKTITNYLNEESLLFDFVKSKYFYGFEDPTFYNNQEMIGCIITHEPQIVLYIPDEDKMYLTKKGVIFD